MSSSRIMTELLVIVTFFVGSVIFSGSADAKTTLRMLSFLPAQHQLSQTAEVFIKEVEKNSGSSGFVVHKLARFRFFDK